MKDNLWDCNTPRQFWLFEPDPPEEIWVEACREALPILGLPNQIDGIKGILSHTLGESQFGSNRWELSREKRLYYLLKPILPRKVIEVIKNISAHYSQGSFPLEWPIERRYPYFQWEVARQIFMITGKYSQKFRYFWPESKQFTFVLTHDVETEEGQKYVGEVADLEESLGFRSSFNFVPECYKLDPILMKELGDRGFEIGVHGLKHDGKLFGSKTGFMNRAGRINHYLDEFKAVGFRSPLTHRQPEWMQVLEIEYDLSFFDVDPFEPMPGGVMSIWPFMIGRFVELPYTLMQDCTLGQVLGETTPRLWLDKLDFIAQYRGMALMITHPDYLQETRIRKIYIDFLHGMKDRGGYWHALPREVARWWRRRADTPIGQESEEMTLGEIALEENRIVIH